MLIRNRSTLLIALAAAGLQIGFAGPVFFSHPVIVSQSGHSGTAASEGANLDDDANVEFISTATSSAQGQAHFRVYDFNASTSGFDAFDILAPVDVNGRHNRFGGDIATGDINDDGYRDIILPISRNNNGPGSISWFENPDGDLAAAWTEHEVSVWDDSSAAQKVRHMSEVAVGDVDGNGRLDIVTRDVSHGIFLVLQNTDGTWKDRIFIETNPREGLDLFDPDGDGDLDIIVNGVWFETPADPETGTFTRYTYGADWYPSGSNGAQVDDYACQIAVRDFNGDGRDDIAISNSEELRDASSTDGKPKGIEVFLAPVDPKTESWTRVVLADEHFSWHSLEPGDLNEDGAIDLISAISTVGEDDTAPEQIIAYLNNGDGTVFTPVSLDAAPPHVYNSSVGDADGDGDLDLFAPFAFNEGPIRYFENVSPSNDQLTGRVEISGGTFSATYPPAVSALMPWLTPELSLTLGDDWTSDAQIVASELIDIEPANGEQELRVASQLPPDQVTRQFIRLNFDQPSEPSGL